MFAAERARERLELERMNAEDAEAAVAEQRMVLNDACSLANVSSQVAGKRPVQGAAVSPDNATLVTADWNGVVAFWALDDSITQVKTLQVCTLAKQHHAGQDAAGVNIFAIQHHAGEDAAVVHTCCTELRGL